MAARELLVLFTILAGARAWLGEYACENIIQFGSRSDVEQCFQDRFPEPVAELFLRCAQNAHVSRAYTVLQDYCQDGRFQDQINSCLNEAEGITLVTQNVAFRTLRTCLDWIPRSNPGSSESNEETDRSLRKRDLSDNEVGVDEQAPKVNENTEESPKNNEEPAKEEVVAEEISVHPTEAAPSLVTEIVSAFGIVTETVPSLVTEIITSFDVVTEPAPSFVTEIIGEFTEAPAASETNEIGKEEEISNDIGIDVEPKPVEEENGKKEDESEEVVIESDEVDNKDVEKDEEVEIDDVGGGDNDEDKADSGENDQSEESDNDDDEEDENDEDKADDDENDQSEESDKDDDEEEENDDEENNSSGESDKDEENDSDNDESNSSSNDDSDEYDFSFSDSDYPFEDLFASYEIDDADRSHEIINARYNRINFAIYLYKK